MTPDQERKLTLRRLVLAEINLARIISIVSGINDLIASAQQQKFECADCGKDLSSVEICDRQDCQWGMDWAPDGFFPAKTKEDGFPE